MGHGSAMEPRTIRGSVSAAGPRIIMALVSAAGPRTIMVLDSAADALTAVLGAALAGGVPEAAIARRGSAGDHLEAAGLRENGRPVTAREMFDRRRP